MESIARTPLTKKTDFYIKKNRSVAMQNELQKFSKYWEQVAEGSIALMRALPPDQYDFRPDAGGRSR